MVDFHSHILPGVDDGSKNVAMSLQMVGALQSQGVDTICATPHFYATHEAPGRFLEKRRRALALLQAELPSDAPRILPGAEVLFFPGISHMEELPSLCLEGTDLLLLEMPFHPWTEYMFHEVLDLAQSGLFTILMAHIERYYFMQAESVWDTLLDNDVLMQSNAEFFLPFGTRRKAIRLLREGRIHLLGTDCHNMSDRAPNMDRALSRIQKHLGKEYLDDMDTLGRSLLKDVL